MHDFIAAIAPAAAPGPRSYFWPMPGAPAASRSFASFAEWRDCVLAFRLPAGVPIYLTEAFDRALKVYLMTWIDGDLMVTAEMSALAALEYAVTDRYYVKERERRLSAALTTARQEGRELTKRERARIERISFADLLSYVVEHDGLTDAQVGLARRTGGTVKDLLTGDREPSLAAMRNARAHGNPFGSGHVAGLLELTRDLILYAYRDVIVRR
jgi:hypothetical protein